MPKYISCDGVRLITIESILWLFLRLNPATTATVIAAHAQGNTRNSSVAMKQWECQTEGSVVYSTIKLDAKWLCNRFLHTQNESSFVGAVAPCQSCIHPAGAWSMLLHISVRKKVSAPFVHAVWRNRWHFVGFKKEFAIFAALHNRFNKSVIRRRKKRNTKCLYISANILLFEQARTTAQLYT